MSEIINNGTVEKQVNIDIVKELHLHQEDIKFVDNFSDVDSIMRIFPDNLQELFKIFGNVVKSKLTISDLLDAHSSELIFPDNEEKRKLDLLWESWYLFLIYLTLNGNGTVPLIDEYKIQIGDDILKVKHIFYLGNKNFEELVSEFLRNESTLDNIKYDLYMFNNKIGLYPSLLSATRKEKIIANISVAKSLSDELTGVKKSGFISIRRIHDVLSEVTEENMDILKEEVIKKIQEVCKNAVS